MAANTTASREARRRKILERGTDRLAIITGRIPDVLSESVKNSNSDQLLRHQELPPQPPPSNSFDQIAALPDVGERGFSSVLPSDNPITNAGNGGSDIEPPLYIQGSSGTLRTSTSDQGSNEQPCLPLSIDQKSNMSTTGTRQILEPERRPRRFFTPSQISSAIATSEKYRLFCSITIALFVVLSYLGFPPLDSGVIKSIISFRPLYLVLVTNLTLVLARLLCNNQRGFAGMGRRESNSPLNIQNDLAERAGKILEVGLMVKKAVEAVSMDCSVYVLIVTAGSSFLQ